MLEVGAHGGYFFVAGDVKQKPGYAGGIHVRKALDYVFSLRLDLMYGQASAETDIREFDMTWMSGSALAIMSLSNFRFDKGVRKVNYYALAGAGANSFKSEFRNENTPRPPAPREVVPQEIAPHVVLGAGIAFRLSNRFNIGLEHQAGMLFGNRADILDGTDEEVNESSNFRDIFNYTRINLNFNLGNPSNKSEPLYWINPLEDVMEDIASVKQRQDDFMLDSDGDGVVDALDQEPDSPVDAPVDTKGRTLDSDRDGIADYKDKEPYYPPRAGERVNSDGVVVNPLGPQGGGGGVTEGRVQEMIDQALEKYRVTEQNNSVADWFLPMIHFATDSYTVKYSDFGNLASIGRMMKSNPNLRLVVAGHTDQTGNESYNDKLSYLRAKAIVDHLVTNHGIGRGRLLIQWKGKSNALVPKSASYMNRRVEFRAAQSDDYEMDPPAGGSSGKSGY
ncbi:MAG: hypothetical protein DHS20C18_33170 [Saprospiraceae bacterium]|nr:MAG: hypothetical protein DHS20C18_33170 [Saprospiraceae bacterium]